MFTEMKSERQEDNLPLMSIDQMDIFEHLDREVAVLVDDEGLPWGQTIRVCLSQKALEEQIILLKRRAITLPLGIVIDFLLKNRRQRLNLYGFSIGDYALDYDELEKMAYAIDSFKILWTCYKEKMTKEASFERLKSRTFYYLGSPILTASNPTFNFDIDNKNGKEFIKLFLSKESAQRNNYKQLQAVPVNLATFKLIVEGKCGLVIEPNRRYNLRFE